MSEAAKHLPTEVESEITGFDSSKLKHAECHEKTHLPTKDGINLFQVVFSWHMYLFMYFCMSAPCRQLDRLVNFKCFRIVF